MTEAKGWLGELEGLLTDRFRRLREERDGGPVFFIEHGLDDEAVCDVRAAVSQEAAAHRLDDTYWRLRALPLLLLATEVGYRYEGTGTDYWPVLEEQLGRELQYSEREALRVLFRRWSGQLGVEPPETPWAQQFSIICWPITHSILPRELHEPLLLAVAETGVSPDEGPAALERLSDWARRRGLRRLLGLLSNRRLAAAVVGVLVGAEEHPGLSQEVCRRIAADVEQRRATRIARARARVAVQRRRRALATKAPPAAASVVALLALHEDGEQATLELVLPGAITAPSSAELEGLRLPLFGSRRSLSVSQLLRSRRVKLRHVSLPAAGGLVRLFEDEHLKGATSPAVTRLLSSLVVDLRPPVAFLSLGGEPRGEQVSTDHLLTGARAWVLLPETTRPPAGCPGVRAKQAPGGWSCFAVDTSVPSTQAWLQEVGISLRKGGRAVLMGVPSKREGGRWLVPAGRDAFLGVVGPTQSVAERYWRLPLENSRGVVTVTAPGGVGVDVETCTPDSAPVVLAELSGQLTTQGLLRGQVTLTVEGPEGCAGLVASARLVERGSVVARSFLQLGPLPTLVPGDAPEWGPLQEFLSTDAARPYRLVVDVAGVARVEVWLDPEEAAVWWSRSGGTLHPASGGEPTELRYAAAALPLSFEDASSAQVVLHQPIDERGGMIQAAGLCRVTGGVRFGLEHADRPTRLLRRLRAPGLAAVDVATLVEGLGVWATARGEDLIAESIRRRVSASIENWVVEVLCGDVWSAEEARHEGSGAPLVAMVTERLVAARAVTDPQAEEVMDSCYGEWRLLLISRFQENLQPLRELFQDAGAVPRMGLAADIADAWEAALTSLLEDAGEEPDVDPIFVDDDVAALVVEAAGLWEEHEERGSLARLVHPRGLFEAVARARLPALPLRSAVGLVAEWAKARRGAPVTWTNDEIGALIGLFSSRFPGGGPEALQSSLGKVLADRGVARAARYVALRRRRGGTSG